MLKARPHLEKQAEQFLETCEIPGPARRNGPALHVKIDGNRVVERRTTELKRLQRQFHGVVARPSRFKDETVEPWLSTSYIPAQQRWSPSLERDIESVCSEAGLSRSTTASVVAAACRGSISQNPGILLSRLLTFQDCLTDPLGRRTVLAMLRTAPTLLRYSPESLRWNCDMLASLLPEDDLPSVLSRAPMLLPAAAITLWGNFEGLRQLLRIDHDAAVHLVVRAPRLLLNTRGALEGRLQDLALLAGERSLRRIATVVGRQPSLLGYFPGTLERNLRHVAGLLGVPLSRVQPLLLRQPTLLMLSQQAVTQRVTALRAALRLDDPADLAAVVLRQPSLLTLSPEAVRRKVDVVEGVLGLHGRPPGELAGVLRAVPQILTLASESVEAKAAALRAAVAPCAGLAGQLEAASPTTVALWLCMSLRRYEHVRAVAEGARTASTAETSGAAQPLAAEAAAGSGVVAAAGVTGATDGCRVVSPDSGSGEAGLGRPLRGRSRRREAEGLPLENSNLRSMPTESSGEREQPWRGRGRPRKGVTDGDDSTGGEAGGGSAGRPRIPPLSALLREAPGGPEDAEDDDGQAAQTPHRTRKRTLLREAADAAAAAGAAGVAEGSGEPARPRRGRPRKQTAASPTTALAETP